MRVLVALVSAVLVLSGCGHTLSEVDEKKIAVYLTDKPEELHPVFSRVPAEGERNHVLNRLRAGLAAMETGNRDLAARTFDEALLTIETIYGGDETAAKARGLFNAEDRKVFRGEPYERAMAYYYRGILYLTEGDYENARASFKSGSLQDSLAEKEEYRQDFALLEFLEGWASHCNGDTDLAREAYETARSHNDGLKIPGPQDNLLVLAELGYAPVKYAAGSWGELLKIRGSSRKGSASARVVRGGRAESLPNRESVLRQAVTRGGREFDSVLAGKVNFKESAAGVAKAGEAVATAGAGVAIGALVGGDQDTAKAAGAVAIASGVASMFARSVSDAVEVIADTRYWDNLPEAVMYGTFYNPASGARNDAPDLLKVVFSGNEKGVRKALHGGDGTCKIVWARSQPVFGGSSLWSKVAGKTFSGDFHADRGGVFGGEHKFSGSMEFSRSGEFSGPYSAGVGDLIYNRWQIVDDKIVFGNQWHKDDVVGDIWSFSRGEIQIQGENMTVRGVYGFKTVSSTLTRVLSLGMTAAMDDNSYEITNFTARLKLERDSEK